MEFRLIQRLCAVCLISLLIPATGFATMPADSLTVTFANNYNLAVVPVPELVTLWLFVTGMIGFVLLKRRSKNTED